MEKKERTVCVLAASNCGTTIQITITEETEDLTNLINKAVDKIKQLEKKDEQIRIVHIDSIKRQKIPEL